VMEVGERGAGARVLLAGTRLMLCPPGAGGDARAEFAAPLGGFFVVAVPKEDWAVPLLAAVRTGLGGLRRCWPGGRKALCSEMSPHSALPLRRASLGRMGWGGGHPRPFCSLALHPRPAPRSPVSGG